MKLYSILLIAAVTGFIACKKTSSGDPVPKISYAGLSKDSVVNAGKDTISIMFTILAVSYTHLDVYKRQLLCLLVMADIYIYTAQQARLNFNNNKPATV